MVKINLEVANALFYITARRSAQPDGLKLSYRFKIDLAGMKNAELPISNSSISAVLERKKMRDINSN